MATSNSLGCGRGVVVACMFAGFSFSAVGQEDVGAMRDRMVRLENNMEVMQKEIAYETLRRQQEQQRDQQERAREQRVRPPVRRAPPAGPARVFGHFKLPSGTNT